MKAWKKFEREVAEAFGGVRNVRVRYDERKGDITHHRYSLECKYGKQIPEYLNVSKPTLIQSSGKQYIACPSKQKPDVLDDCQIGDYKFLEDGIKQAEGYNPSLIPVLCVKRPRMRGFVYIFELGREVKMESRPIEKALPRSDASPPAQSTPLIVKV